MRSVDICDNVLQPICHAVVVIINLSSFIIGYHYISISFVEVRSLDDYLRFAFDWSNTFPTKQYNSTIRRRTQYVIVAGGRRDGRYIGESKIETLRFLSC